MGPMGHAFPGNDQNRMFQFFNSVFIDLSVKNQFYVHVCMRERLRVYLGEKKGEGGFNIIRSLLRWGPYGEGLE